MATAETARLIASLELQDKNFTRGLKNIERGVNKVDRRLGAVSGAVNRNVARGIDTLISKGGEFLTGTVRDAAEFETAITGVAKTVEGDISGIEEDLKKLSTQIPLTFVELAGIAEMGGAMGIAKKDLVEFTEQVAILGSTTNVSVEDGAASLGQLTTVLGLTGDELDNFVASLVDLGNKGNSTEAQILEIAKRTGAASKTIGIAKDETLAWASAAANLGLGEELAGTNLQKFFVESQKIVARGGGDLQELGKIAGMTGKQFKKSFKKDATGALTAFIAGLKDLNAEQRVLKIEELFGKGSGMTRLLLGLSEALDDPTSGLTASLETNAEAWAEGTAAQEEAEKRFKTSESLFKRLDNSVKIVSATIGEALLPVLNDLATEGIEFLNKPGTQRGIKDFAKSIGEGVRSLAKIITSINWGAVAGFLKTAAGFAGQLVTWFGKMPDWAQAFLIGGFVATKLPVVGSIVSELGKGLIKGVLGMTAGVVHINAGTVVGGGGAPVPGGGKGGGGIFGGKGLFGGWGIGKILLGATGVGLAAMFAEEFSDEISGFGSDLGFAWRDWLKGQTGIELPNININDLEWPFGPKNTPTILPEIFGGNGLLGGNAPGTGGRKPGQTTGARPRGTEIEGLPKLTTALNKNTGALLREPKPPKPMDKVDPLTMVGPLVKAGSEQKAELGNIKNAMATNKTAIDNAKAVASQKSDAQKAELGLVKNQVAAAKSAVQVGARSTSGAATRAGSTAAAAASAGASRIVAAIWAARPIIQPTNVIEHYTTNYRAGAPSGSRRSGPLP